MNLPEPVRMTPGSEMAPDVLDLIRRAFAYMQDRIEPPSSMHRLTVEAIDSQCASGEVWTIGRPPHACVFFEALDDRLYIGKLAVDDAARGQGCARRLIELAAARARGRGKAFLELKTRIELIENHEIFRRLGFRKTCDGAHEGYDRPTYIVMRRAL
jgi:GNAT superfamily N-acetyltransferase